jgi:hypothetical protein
MPRRTLPLTDKQIQNAKPDPDKRIKALFDGSGLYLEAHADGARRWRLKFRHDGKDNLMSLGPYPEVSLSEARSKREAARKMLDSGTNPIEEKRAAKAAWAWFGAWRADKAPSNVEKIRGRLEKDVLPWIGDTPIAEVKGHTIFTICDRIQRRGAVEMAHRVLVHRSIKSFTYNILIW